MTAVRGYLAVLGTTALLTASVVVVLLVGSGFAAFDASSDAGEASSPLERIRVEGDAAAGNRGGAGAPRTGTEDAPSDAERRAAVDGSSDGGGAPGGSAPGSSSGGSTAPSAGDSPGGGGAGGGPPDGSPGRGPGADTGAQYGGLPLPPLGRPLAPPARDTVGEGGHPLVGQLR
jgi:hypothetical protein